MDEQARGVAFPLLDGDRSSTRAGQRVVGAAAGVVDAGLAARIGDSTAWHADYVDHMATLVRRELDDPAAATGVPRAGLDALHDHLVVVEADGERPLADALDDPDGEPLRTATLDGTAARPSPAALPLHGDLLGGVSLRRRVDAWVADGVVEPSAATAVHRVLDEPAWLDLSDTTVVVFGGSSEMGPLQWLARWGAHVLVVDLPGRAPWTRVVDLVDAGCGTGLVPTDGAADGHDEVVARAGADLLRDAPRVAAWLDEHVTADGPVVLGNYVYAHGATNVLVSAAVDALTARLLDRVPDAVVAALGTPTDVYAVPPQAAAASRERWRRRGPVRRALGAVGRGVAYAPNVPATGDGRAVVDCQVPQQGCNYALAKRVHRWRARDARATGHRVSYNVAPATRTRSVTDRWLLAAAFGGAPRFGVEVFEPATSRALMALLLVHDLRADGVAGDPASEVEHPLDLLAEGACHGGLWRMAHAPRSVLPVAAAFGLARRDTWR